MQEENNVTGNTRSLNWWLRFIVVAVVLFAALIAVYSYIFIYGGLGMIASNFTPETKQENITTALPDLQGGIFLSTITAIGEDTINLVPVLVLTNTSSPINIPIDQLEDGSIFSLQHAFSADFTKLAFLGWPLVENLSYQTPAIYRADVGGGAASDNEFIQNIQRTATLALEPDAEDYFREGPVISSTGDILYSSLSEADYTPEPTEPTNEAEEWTIYRLDTNNERQTLTKGLAPKWVDANTFAFLKNDGIYLYNINTNEEKLIWSLGFIPTLANAFDVSDDGMLLAISNREAGYVTIFKANDLGGETPVEILSEVSVIASELTFAADNSYLAILRLVRSNDTGSDSFARLMYYGLDAKEFHPTYVNLNELQVLNMTDWK